MCRGFSVLSFGFWSLALEKSKSLTQHPVLLTGSDKVDDLPKTIRGVLIRSGTAFLAS